MKFNILAKSASLFTVITIAASLFMPLSASAEDFVNCLRQETANASIVVNGAQATATFTIPAACGHQQVSFVSYTAPNARTGQPFGLQKVFNSTTQTLNPGTYSLSVAVPDCFYQIDLVRGEVIVDYSHRTYHAENRLLAAKHGGTRACVPVTQTTPPVPTPPVTPPAVQSTTTTKALPNTGPGSVISLGVLATISGTLGHYLYRRRHA